MVAWWSVQAALAAVALLAADVDTVVVRRLGIDEHRNRSVRCYREAGGTWRRYEPGGTSRSRGRMSTFVDLDTGRVLGVVDGRDRHGVGEWLVARCARWRDRVEVVAIDPSAAFRNALGERLPHAALSVHAFHWSNW